MMLGMRWFLCGAALVLGSVCSGCMGRGGGGRSGPPDDHPDGAAQPDSGLLEDDGGPVVAGPDADSGDAGSGYAEALCDPLADLSDLSSSYRSSRFRETVREIAVRRYPIAVELIDGQSDSELERWFGSTSSFADVMEGFETAVHEGAHIWDIDRIEYGEDWPYWVRDDLVIHTAYLENFERSEILELHVDRATDFYDDVYLEGVSGTQGLNNLLDEYNAYTHSLAAKYCTRDSIAPGYRQSTRDGTLTMMYYVELYLKIARTDHPADYRDIVGDPGHIELILTVWERAEFWLDVTASHPELGLQDDVIETWVYDPDNVMEIDQLRDYR